MWIQHGENSTLSLALPSRQPRDLGVTSWQPGDRSEAKIESHRSALTVTSACLQQGRQAIWRLPFLQPMCPAWSCPHSNEQQSSSFKPPRTPTVPKRRQISAASDGTGAKVYFSISCTCLHSFVLQVCIFQGYLQTRSEITICSDKG